MRYVSSIPSSTYNGLGGRAVKELSSVYASKGGQGRRPRSPGAEQYDQAEHHDAATQGEWVPGVQEDRRKAGRRISHQSLLLDLRSERDRRHHNLLEGDIVEHIDEEA